MSKITCPYCESENWTKEGDRFHCNECDWMFDEEDITREDLRHKISAHLMETTEEHPRTVNVPVGEKEAVGLSSLELPVVIGAFHDPEAIVWFNIYGCEEPIEFDSMDTDDLKSILEYLEEN